MMDSFYLISFGIGLALLGLWKVAGSGHELAYLRQQRLPGGAPKNPDRFKRGFRE